MATPAPAPSSSTSRRSRESAQGDMTIGNFRRMEEIGRGSFATVYKAIHVKRGGYVAIKSVHLQKLNKKLKENLYSEIHILKGLHHPHIVALIDCQETSAHIHLVMEFCQLGDLSYFIKKRDTLSRHASTADMIKKYPNPPAGGLNEVVVRHFLKQLSSALEFLRNRNFIHRDVKPQNLLLNPSPLFFARAQPDIVPYTASENSLIPVAGIESLPMLKIADFGFARSLPSTSLAETLCGSPLYMAPEILRYEKYDAKADLWSVGTVLYEMMVGKPPFRASNHVELLRRIERGEDKIKFPEDTTMTDPMRQLIRGLLKRNPVERMSFVDFFDNPVVKDEIPGLIGEDIPKETPKDSAFLAVEPLPRSETHSPDGRTLRENKGYKAEATVGLSKHPQEISSCAPPIASTRADPTIARQPSGTPLRPTSLQRRATGATTDSPVAPTEPRDRVAQARRPSMVSHATAPARPDFHGVGTRQTAVAAADRQSSRNSSSAGSSVPKESTSQREHIPQRKDDIAAREAAREARDARERAAQDVAFERDYVVVEKRAVEVNAFADELAASPRIHGGAQQNLHHGAMVRRGATQGTPNPTTGAQVTPARAMQIASGKRPDQIHHRQSSYERRYGRDATSATSAISKAINMASGRLFNMGFSPPLGIGRGGPSPPTYSPFPAYPTAQGSLTMIGDGSRAPVPIDEDSKAVQVIEESATRSDVVYGFAEVKYKQLIPLAPSMDHGLGLRQAGIPEKDESGSISADDEGLTVDAVVTLSEEALVLYVKALSLLARSMDIAGAWWARKNRGEVVEESTSPRTQRASTNDAAVGNRVNNVVQWVRNRFNEVLEKAEFVRLKLIEAQRRLPEDHQSHPSNHPAASGSAAGMGTSADNVVVSSGVTAEKLMYDRALEMSRSAAVNELVGEDLPGCEIAYVTAVRMLEAVLENDEDPAPKQGSTAGKESKGSRTDDDAINGVEAEDRKVVVKLVQSIRGRLAALRKKMQIMAKRTATASAPPTKPPPTSATTPAPAVAGTPPH
ncbi:serine threonine protein kinase [Lasallia pustulata]|uniref:Serine/threonine-protein kinase ATG1 n=1 Tax=Lasallia pustulata TaxID=136370 RepID=A0A1W5CZA1_9LECA|nr:serine threonine protein kinase [Lasallia pustulata]